MHDFPENDARLQALKTFYETLTPQSLDQIPGIYDECAWFKDPFNQVQGVAEIKRIFTHMFATVGQPKFVVDTAFSAGDQAFLAWQFSFRRSGKTNQAIVVRGASHVVFNQQGKVCSHRDYWDAAEELYEKLPVLGAVMRLLRNRLKAR